MRAVVRWPPGWCWAPQEGGSEQPQRPRASTCATLGTRVSVALTGKVPPRPRRTSLRPCPQGPPPLTHRYCRCRASMSALTLLIWDRWLFSSSRSISSRWAFFMASMAVDRMWPSAPTGLGGETDRKAGHPPTAHARPLAVGPGGFPGNSPMKGMQVCFFLDVNRKPN